MRTPFYLFLNLDSNGAKKFIVRTFPVRICKASLSNSILEHKVLKKVSGFSSADLEYFPGYCFWPFKRPHQLVCLDQFR